MRYASILSFFLTLVLLSSCKKDSASIVPNDLLGMDWFRTDQNAAGNATYVPAALAPPRLGHDGFRFESDGSFVQYMPAPTDGTVSTPGTWTTNDGQTYHIILNNPQLAPYDLLVGTVTNTTLTARRLP